MKQHKNLNAKLNILMSDATPKALLIGLDGVNFSKRIAVKHTVFRKSANLPALVFLKLFGTAIGNKITNISRIEFINNYFRLHLNFYVSVRMIGQLNQTLSHCHQYKKLYYLVDSSEGKFSPSISPIRKEGLKGFSFQRMSFINFLLLVSDPYHNFLSVLRGEGKNVIAMNEPVHLPLRVPIYQNKAILKPENGSTISKGTILHSLQNNKQRFRHNRLGAFSDETLDSLLSRNDVGTRYSDKTLLRYGSEKMRIIPITHTLSHRGNGGDENGNRRFSIDKNSITKTINKSADLIFRKPAAQKIDIVSEDRDYIHKDKQISTKATDNLIKNLSNVKTGDKIEINTIIDRVYKILEKRIAIEKDKRGWL